MNIELHEITIEKLADGYKDNAEEGVVDAGLLVDDDSKHLTTLPAEFHVDKRQSRVVLTFTRIA